MPNQPAQAIANEFLRKQGRQGMPSQMWLQKLVYIAQGWNLAINGEPLVSEPVEAWDGGPVFRRLWNHIRDFGIDQSSRLLVNPYEGKPFSANLTDSEKSVIEHVWEKYRLFSGRDFSNMTHRPGTPWTKTYLEKGRDQEISREDIKSHYVALAMAGRANSQ